LSVHDADISDVTLLHKPLSGNLLQNAIDEQMNLLVQQASAAKVPTLSAATTFEDLRVMNSPHTLFKVNDRRNALPDSATQARIIRGSCSQTVNIDLNNPPNNSTLYYDPSILLQQELKSAIKQCRREYRPLRLNLSDGKYIALLPETEIALTNLSDSKLRPRCILPLQQQIRIDYPDDREIPRLQANSTTPQDMDSLLWKVSLWSARGRLPLGTKPDSSIGLRQWPNLTRLLATPQFLRIAALWAKTPLPLSKTVELLNIEARYVCAFFSACYALEMIQILSATKDQGALQSNPPQSSAKRNLLQRILQRLRLV
jgi:hypothetical protein